MALRFKVQHDEMLALAEDILGAARSEAPERATALMRLRLQFARAVNDHCKQEGTQVRAATVEGRLSPQTVDEMNAIVARWRSDLALCNSQWPPSRILENPQGFYMDFAPLVEALRIHVRREERDLLPSLS